MEVTRKGLGCRRKRNISTCVETCCCFKLARQRPSPSPSDPFLVHPPRTASMAVLSSPLILIQSIPPVTRIFTLTTIACSGLYAWFWWKGLASEAADYMTVVPGSALFHPWTLVTSMFVETTVFEVCQLWNLFRHTISEFMPVHCIHDICPSLAEIPRKIMGKH